MDSNTWSLSLREQMVIDFKVFAWKNRQHNKKPLELQDETKKAEIHE
jgi:hypothetical protein